MRSPLCRHCGKDQRLTKKELSMKKKISWRRSKESGVKWGRPLKHNHKLIVELRREGLSLSEVAYRAKCSVGAVQYALRISK